MIADRAPTKREHLTPQRIAAFACLAGQQQAFLWDDDPRALAVRVTAGEKAYVFQAKLNGRVVRVTIGRVGAGTLAAARAKAASDKAAAGIAAAAEKAAAAKAAPAAPAPFDVAKFAGIFAAVGLAVGAIGTAIAAVVTGFLKLNWWQMPLALAGLILIISGPSMIIAWLKLRQRNLGPLLDANGWAVNARARINIPFGGSLTKTASLPEGAERSLQDPFAEKKSRWPYYLALVILLGIVLYVLNVFGLLSEWTRGLIGHPR